MFDVKTIDINLCKRSEELYSPDLPINTIWDIMARCDDSTFDIILKDLEQQYGKNLTFEQIGSYI